MADALTQLEAAQVREERERDTLLSFVKQVADGQLTKSRAVIRAKSLLRELSTPGVSPSLDRVFPQETPLKSGEGKTE